MFIEAYTGIWRNLTPRPETSPHQGVTPIELRVLLPAQPSTFWPTTLWSSHWKRGSGDVWLLAQGLTTDV